MYGLVTARSMTFESLTRRRDTLRPKGLERRQHVSQPRLPFIEKPLERQWPFKGAKIT
ncbi:hypothetical protein FC75_GL000907 [Lacticaseibacillus camelliae DSM 22697 = JCM 13995]|uniref:Uncharacterized protein n=1 Tax=Lacticaseibacillus camelliae DSM 22697 = JCM 13995 TaxID=1423730 RepID=A0A0R2F9Z9_9LACO|nr:hypothetical protein FC75_GL000907 [Lacticaseibacillus camelliae DSM 22697 = JCM 13995]